MVSWEIVLPDDVYNELIELCEANGTRRDEEVASLVHKEHDLREVIASLRVSPSDADRIKRAYRERDADRHS